MATKYLIANGATFSFEPAGGSAFIPVGQLKTTAYSGSKLDLEDITTLSSNLGYREYAPTLRDAGMVAIEGVFDPLDPGQQALTAAFDVALPISVQHQFPVASDESTKGPLQTFAAYVTERPTFDAAVGKTSSFKANLKITGPITTTYGS